MNLYKVTDNRASAVAIADIPVVDYVLGKIPAEQKETFDASIEQASKAAEMFMTQRIDLVMNRYNKK